ncbi:hypothetical protein T10_491 [Trichinella papuae]|uniref:Uncharacterized protein n=1 Tax=Trichinella papuae TaxID=268474 RepID=A0A0V1N221_9BILA|nr:hypothetical protein T10_491 [Trichinella papuae]
MYMMNLLNIISGPPYKLDVSTPLLPVCHAPGSLFRDEDPFNMFRCQMTLDSLPIWSADGRFENCLTE